MGLDGKKILTKMSTVRKLALQNLEEPLKYSNFKTAIQTLNSADQALFHELTQGTFREWKFLEWVLKKYIKKNPRKKLKTLLLMSSYQILFLDRIPAYAVFSEAKNISHSFCSVAEQKFLQGVLKNIEREKIFFLDIREKSLKNIKQGVLPSSELDWAILNIEPDFLNAFLVEDRNRALAALVQMKQKAKLIGYLLPGSMSKNTAQRHPSTLTKRACVFAEKEFLTDPLAHVQGEASQWICDQVANSLFNFKKENLKILELSSGKGGKFLSTLAALNEINAVPSLEWTCADNSHTQLQILQKDILPVIKNLWPQTKIEIHQTDWNHPILQNKKFDLVWCDAPCTGFGSCSKHPEILLTRGREAVKAAQTLSLTQKKLCEAGLGLLNNGGIFVYSVCTITKAETVDICEFIEQKFLVKPFFQKYLWPGAAPAPEAEGFFACAFKNETVEKVRF